MPVPTPKFDPETELLDSGGLEPGSSEAHNLRTCPILTREAWTTLPAAQQPKQYGVLGALTSVNNEPLSKVASMQQRLYVNTNAPFSAVVCGVQGAGKSHTVSTLLESMIKPNVPTIGRLTSPMSCLVLHRGEGGTASRPSEAAWISVSDNPQLQRTPVRVFVSRSFLATMKKVYSIVGSHVTVEPLLFQESDLDAEAFLSLMAVGSSDGAPLYMQIVLSILRELGENFSYAAFKQKLDLQKRNFNPAQVAGLEQRMSLLTPFLMDAASKKKFKAHGSRFTVGQITIVDLSDPFIDPASACALFNIVTRLFVKASDAGQGKVLLVDEAHKYLSSSSSLTDTLLTINREQRHLGMRMIISTQEPTVIPDTLLDLCPVAILHRFSSPTWWDHIKKHVSANLSSDEAFNRIVQLKTGEAILLAPSGLRLAQDNSLVSVGRNYLTVRVRKRVTKDGGASVLMEA
jgi:hypothetical protein